jgi:HAMP domain-containing protein
VRTTTPVRGDGRYRGRGEMTELERLLQLFVSLQILFGSRRGGVAPLLVIAALVGGWFVWSWLQNPLRALEAADRKWDSGDSISRIAAIADYKVILRKKDPLDIQRYQLQDRNERIRLYQRVIQFHIKFSGNDEDEARDWIDRAWRENIRDMNFGEPELDDFYRKRAEQIRARGVSNPFETDLY